ncbi:DUF1741-domain-containing protein [Eremomyces bilateralis CBS 781.70]|uniref:DUF1741-domain-containing protein n=1 Tax=Eremomyces bilateralis CBS 781.70 TaxID=1392243 RepID=A0A6G1FTL7_9PEZI|nr:DUF1741-domain-containing protein [Eremomyces bilateralis CBS 781.70]KAF1809114.1 DUF1741-domain-containing protein [Eremomyces bilateralis CBS 781.70]
MEQSPLSQQARPDVFQPKVIKLYESLLLDDEDEAEKPEGFWREFFLHKPDTAGLRQLLANLTPDDMLHLQFRTQQLVSHAIAYIKTGRGPSDEVALDTLTVFLVSVMTKRYTNPSADIIAILTGLSDADATFADLVSALDWTMRNGRTLQLKLRAVRVALSVTSGSYQTGLVSYFTHKDLFPALMKLIQESDATQAAEPFVLLGLLANYNKFEFQNPYQLRLNDFVNDATMKMIVSCIGTVCASIRDRYVTVQDDAPEGWSLGTTLTYFGLGGLASRPSTPSANSEETAAAFASLPSPDVAILLPTYDFVNANKLFCSNFVLRTADTKLQHSAFGNYLSLTSYLFQHAHRSNRATYYTYISLYTIQILVEDPILVKHTCSEESKTSVRLCRQRQPFLPAIKGDRELCPILLDLMIDGINHNLRRRLDVQFYLLCIGILLRIISFMAKSRTRIVYHWAELWRSLLSFIRFLTSYASDIKPLTNSHRLVESLTELIALSLSVGESFLPDTASYDDLFYKLVETGDTLTKFRDAYNLRVSRSSSMSHPTRESSSIEILTGVSSHYYSLLETQGKGKLRSKHLSPKEVSNVIKQGYETLSIQGREDLDQWEGYREADHRAVMKRVARMAVEDAKLLIQEM